MNRIVLDKEIDKQVDDSILFVNNNDNVNKVKIKVIKDTNLELFINNSNIDIEVNILDDVKANIYNTVTTSGKIKYTYNLDYNSNLNIEKYNESKEIKEDITINLNGELANINYLFKTISLSSESYSVTVNHNKSKTISNIINHGVNINDGNIVFTVSSFVPHNIKGCTANQVNRIINLTNNKCIIKPNLFIDEEDVVANHSALIGKFSDEEMFYMNSRGLDYDTALNLLIKGFLFSGINEANIKDLIEEKINEYWR